MKKYLNNSTTPDPGRRTLASICIYYAVTCILSLLIILGLRGTMNVLNRMDSILKRLDDYPYLYDSYQSELQEWDKWWINKDLAERAEEAAVIFLHLDQPESESEKLEYIAELLRADEAFIASPNEQEAPVGAGIWYEGSDSVICASSIEDGRYIFLRFSTDLKDAHYLSSEITDSFIRRVEAGLPGHVMILHEGELSVYPKDDAGTVLQQMVKKMLARGELNPDEQRQRAVESQKVNSVSWKFNVSDTANPADRYILYCSAYAENDDYVIGAVPTSEMLRLAGKRSWSLWLLCVSVMILLGVFLWRTRMCPPDPETENSSISARNRLLLATAQMLLIFSILYIQQMSAVSQSEQTASDEAAFLQYVLQDEKERRGHIIEEYDSMYTERVEGVASLLSDHPEMADPYMLYQLDRSLRGSGLQITGLEGNHIASDQSLIQQPSANGGTDSRSDPVRRTYQAVLHDAQGKAYGVVKLSTYQQDMDDLLNETEPQEIISELHLLDTLHVVAVNHDDRDVILASTYEKWVGDTPKEHGVDTEPFYDGYEGLVNFGGSSCYSKVFQYEDTLVAVGSEGLSLLVFLGGVLLLLVPLALLLLFGIYHPVVRKTAELPAPEMPMPDPATTYVHLREENRENPSPLQFIYGYMIAFFANTVLLYLVTNGKASGVTYNLVRGTWSHGVNAVTLATFLILISMVLTIHEIVALVLRRLSVYFSQRAKTISQLFLNAVGYVGVIIVILYTLRMFGVNTATLVGGVGATALVFTLGANSLISDVLSGIFIIFDGDYAIGDKVDIGDFSGIVTDISMRNTSLENPATHDVKIIRNSMIKELINRSRNVVIGYLEFQIGRDVELAEARIKIREALKGLDRKYPQLVGEPFYAGVVSLPEMKLPGVPLAQCTVCVGFRCLDIDRRNMEFQLREELVKTVNELQYGETDGILHIRLDNDSAEK